MDVKEFFRLNKKITPMFAHGLLASMPKDHQGVYYDIRWNKYFKQTRKGQLLAWSTVLRKWFLWLHPSDQDSLYHWSISQINEKACLYEYQEGDQVLYMGIMDDHQSKIYTVIGYDSDKKVILSDGEKLLGGFYMKLWRLATLDERLEARRLF